MLFVAARLLAAYAMPFDLMANVSYFAAVPLAAVAILAASIRRLPAAVVATASAAVAAAPMVLSIERVQTEPASTTAKVVFCNIEGQVGAVKPFLALIEREQPDLIAIVEAEKPVVDELLQSPRLTAVFPFRITPRIGLEWPHVMLSRHPLEPIKMQDTSKRNRSLYTFHRAMTVALPVGKVIFSVEHLPSPRRTESWKDGNQRIERLGEIIRDQLAPADLPIMIAGDFNTTPTGYRYRLLRAQTGLRPNSFRSLPAGTWPSSFPAYCRLPLDRIWGSQDVIFLSSKVMEDIGSDHRPISVVFALGPR